MVLGIDTSNYSTSAALYDGERMHSVTRLLPVKAGEKGLRQSDAVFHHTAALPRIIEELKACAGSFDCIEAIGVSTRPRPEDGSYMPCFLCGEGLAESIGTLYDIPVYKLSHQEGHIFAALYSCGKLSYIAEKQEFIAFHVSGGTTEAVLCSPDESGFSVTRVMESSDLKAGQLIDRAGVLMGLHFPCGIELEKLAEKCGEDIKVKPLVNNGIISLSGFENRIQKIINEGKSQEYTAKYTLSAVLATIDYMTRSLREKYGELPIVYAGGVMSNKFIKANIMQKYNSVFFAAPEYSRDNAAGAAVYAYMSKV